MEKLTHEALLEALDYNPETGIFTWRKYRHVSGKRAGSVNSVGYAVIGFNGSDIYAHRLAWFYVHGRWPSEMLDHIDNDKLNNRIGNLREAGYRQNARNRPLKKTNKSGYKGVYWFKLSNKWRASITVDRKNICLGLFTNVEDAADAYRAAAIKYYGEFAHR